jgi:F0F1-type ATP synthase membrane subunit b/b'
MPTRRATLPGLTLLAVVFSLTLVSPTTIAAQGHEPAPAPQHGAAPVTPAAAQPTAKGAQPVEHAAAEEGHGSEHAVRDMVARLLNFGILVGALAYFLKAPIATYLSGRSTQIRQDLVAAAELRRTATAQLEQIQQKLGALPAELAALKARGEEDVQAEKVRIAQAAAAERERLVDQTRREIDMRLRLARRELTEYAAQLAVSVAQDRITRTITPDDQLRLVDRYATQLKEAR